MDHAGRIVERLVIDHKPRVRRAREHREQFADGDVLRHGDDVGPRHHHAFGPAFAQPQDVLEHRGLCGRECRTATAGGQHLFEIGAGRCRFPAEQDMHDACQPAVMRFARLAARPWQISARFRVTAGPWGLRHRCCHVGICVCIHGADPAARLALAGRFVPDARRQSRSRARSTRPGVCKDRGSRPPQDVALGVLHLFGFLLAFVIVPQKVQEAVHREMGDMMGERLMSRLASRSIVSWARRCRREQRRVAGIGGILGADF